MNERTRKRLWRWLFLSISMLIVASLILVLGKDFTTRGFSNATFIPGAVLFFLFLLRLLKNGGAFDVLGYALARMVHNLRRRDVAEIKPASEFIEDKRISRQKQEFYYLPEIVVASVFILAAAILAYV